MLCLGEDVATILFFTAVGAGDGEAPFFVSILSSW